MARRTGAPTQEGTGEPEQLSPSAAPVEDRPFWFGWAALVIVIAVGVAMVVFLSTRSHPKPVPVNNPPSSSPSAAAPSAAASAPAGVPATTYDAFVALPPAQQQAVMQQAITAYNNVLNEASETLDASALPLVATGHELPILQQAVATAAKNRQPARYQNHETVLAIVMSPRPFSFVSVNVSYTETSQYLDPSTSQPIGTSYTSSGRTSFTLVIENGVWKVSEHIQDPGPGQ
jgi:hypothetical protein